MSGSVQGPLGSPEEALPAGKDNCGRRARFLFCPSSLFAPACGLSCPPFSPTLGVRGHHPTCLRAGPNRLSLPQVTSAGNSSPVPASRRATTPSPRPEATTYPSCSSVGPVFSLFWPRLQPECFSSIPFPTLPCLSCLSSGFIVLTALFFGPLSGFSGPRCACFPLLTQYIHICPYS